MLANLVLIRHGHSEWNLANRFTGWTDISITEIGLNEAKQAGETLARHQLFFDAAHLSALRRTRQTLDALLIGAQHPALTISSSWQLNERHYGQLQGMRKDEILATWPESDVRRWWRGYDHRPPVIDTNDPRHPRFDSLYTSLSPSLLPIGESLQDCQNRLLPYWQQQIAPKLQQGQHQLVVSHGNTMRALIMHLESISPEQVEKLEIPAATPLLYQFDEQLSLTRVGWLNTPDITIPSISDRAVNCLKNN